MPLRTLIRRVEDRLFEKWIIQNNAPRKILLTTSPFTHPAQIAADNSQLWEPLSLLPLHLAPHRLSTPSHCNSRHSKSRKCADNSASLFSRTDAIDLCADMHGKRGCLRNTPIKIQCRIFSPALTTRPRRPHVLPRIQNMGQIGIIDRLENPAHILTRARHTTRDCGCASPEQRPFVVRTPRPPPYRASCDPTPVLQARHCDSTPQKSARVAHP